MWWFLVADGVKYRHVRVWEVPGEGWRWTRLDGVPPTGTEKTQRAAQASAEKAWLAWWVEATVRANRHLQPAQEPAEPVRGIRPLLAAVTGLDGEVPVSLTVGGITGSLGTIAARGGVAATLPSFLREVAAVIDGVNRRAEVGPGGVRAPLWLLL